MKPQSQFRQVLNTIGQDIVNGRWPDGEPVHPNDIATEIGVSRTVVREAIRVLEDKGLLAARPGWGTRVRPTTTWNLLDPDITRWIGNSPNHPDLKIQAKEFAEALLMLTPAFGENPHLSRALATLSETDAA